MYYLHCIKKISKAKILQMSFHFIFSGYALDINMIPLSQQRSVYT